MAELQANTRASDPGFIKYCIGRTWMWAFGWKVIGEIPQAGKFVLVGAFHTSNWDFPFAIAASYVFRIKLHWLGKQSLFRWPFGGLMRFLGGIPVDRSQHLGAVEQIKNQFDLRDNLHLAIAAKGTRQKTEYWKSGFYWIAYTAQVPVLCCSLDYKNKQLSAGLRFLLSGDVKQDMEKIREFFTTAHGKNPQLEDNIRLREEDL